MKIFLRIKGMHCESCEKLIKSELEEDVKKIKIDIKSGKAEFEFDESKTGEKEIKEKIRNLGYKIEK